MHHSSNKNMSTMKSILSIILFSLPCYLSSQVNLAIGNIPAGKSIQVFFDVKINDPFPPMTPSVSSQGTVSGGNFANVLTDDPDVGGTADPTVTIVNVCDHPNYMYIGPGSNINDPANWENGCIPPLNDPSVVITIEPGTTFVSMGIITGTIINFGTYKGNASLVGAFINNGVVNPGN